MDNTVNTFNVEIAIFLRAIRGYINNSGGIVSNKTQELLGELVSSIDDLAHNAKVIDLPNDINVDFLMDLDDRYYGLRQNIVCRLCLEPIMIDKEEFDAHEQKRVHLSRQPQNHSTATPQIQCSPKCLPVHRSNETDSVETLGVRQSQSIRLDDASKRSKFQSRFQNIFKNPDRSHQNTKEDNHVFEPKKNPSRENLFGGKYWPSVYSDSSDSEGAVAVFNYDSKYLIELRKVPSTATRQEIHEFLNNMEILNGLNGIHFLVESNAQKDGEVFVQLENLKDFQTALKLQNKCLDGVSIEVSTADVVTFKDLVKMRKIPSKERVVALKGVPLEHSEKHIRALFNDLVIERIHLVQNDSNASTCDAFVKFINIGDVEKATKKSDKAKTIRVIRSSDMQMRRIEGGKIQPYPKQLETSPESSLDHKIMAESLQHSSGPSCDPNVGYFVKVAGLPWNYTKQKIIDLFLGSKVDANYGVEMQINAKKQFTGLAYVAFENAEDFELAVRIDLSHVGKYIKVSRATKAEYLSLKQYST